MVLLLPSALVVALVVSAADVTLCAGNPKAKAQIFPPIVFICSNDVFPLIGINRCVARNLGHDSVVCECNSTYCDGVGPVSLPPLGQYSTYLSSMAGSRMEPGHGQVQVNSTGAGKRMSSGILGHQCFSLMSFLLPGLRLTIVPYQKYQRIKGFGGAMTDAAAINILSLSAGAQEQLLRQYFSKEGKGYKLYKDYKVAEFMWNSATVSQKMTLKWLFWLDVSKQHIIS